MNSEHDEWIVRAAAGYNTDGGTHPDTDEMWSVIEQQLPDAARPLSLVENSGSGKSASTRKPLLRATRLLRYAAVLAVGIIAGRMSISFAGARQTSDSGAVQVVSHAEVERGLTDAIGNQVAMVNSPSTLQYIGETVALLSSLQLGARQQVTDSAVHAQAADLLFTTRLMLDDPGSAQPRLRELLEDLELILVQIIQTPPTGHYASTDMEPIRGTVEERALVPRLLAVAATSNQQQ